jgi:hypothetical protein
LGSFPFTVQKAKAFQRDMWELKMVLNEVTMARSLSPRLLQSGNFGFMREEVLEALGMPTPQQEERKAMLQQHADDQMAAEGIAVSNPRVYPIAARSSPTPSPPPATPSPSPSATAPSPAALSPAAKEALAKFEQLEPELQQYHWASWSAAVEHGAPDHTLHTNAPVYTKTRALDRDSPAPSSPSPPPSPGPERAP